MNYLVTEEFISREVFKIEADSQEKALAIAIDRYSNEKKSVSSEYETVLYCKESPDG